MKNAKKIASVLLALVLAMTCMMVGFAATTDPSMDASSSSVKITINYPSDRSLDNTTYKVYQLLTAENVTPDPNDNTKAKIDNPVLGQNVKGDLNKTATQVVNDLKNLSGKALGDAAYAMIDTALTPVATLTKAAPSIENLVKGYYVVVSNDEDAKQEGHDISVTAAKYMVVAAADTTITPKSEKVESHKYVLDNGATRAAKDSSDVADVAAGQRTQEYDGKVYGTSADYSIGDDVPFLLTGKVSDDFDLFTAEHPYTFNFIDTQSAGLGDPENVVVKVDGVEVPAANYTLIPNTDGDNDFTVEINLTALNAIRAEDQKIGAGSLVTVAYTSNLDTDATIGNPGNPNDMKLEYTNDYKSGSTNKTKEEHVVVFTYTTIVNKVDGNNNNAPLAGAEFTLTNNTTGKTYSYAVVENQTSFEFKGLDAGEYTLHESKVPDGYNQAKDITFTIDATHKTDGLPGDEANDDQIITLDVTSTSDVNGKKSFTATDTSGIISTNVVNNMGTELPTTGGMGTTIFYIVGVVLVLGAAILLITKRRLAAKAN